MADTPKVVTNIMAAGFPWRDLPFINPQTGMVNEDWLRLLHALWVRTGGDEGPQGTK